MRKHRKVRGKQRWRYGIEDLQRITGLSYRAITSRISRGEFEMDNLESIVRWLIPLLIQKWAKP